MRHQESQDGGGGRRFENQSRKQKEFAVERTDDEEINQGQLSQFKKILPDSKNLGINITFAQQKHPRGLPDAFIIGEKFINNSKVAMILGDNFFYGQNLSGFLSNCVKLKQGAKIVLHSVKNPEMFVFKKTAGALSHGKGFYKKL